MIGVISGSFWQFKNVRNDSSAASPTLNFRPGFGEEFLRDFGEEKNPSLYNQLREVKLAPFADGDVHVCSLKQNVMIYHSLTTSQSGGAINKDLYSISFKTTNSANVCY